MDLIKILANPFYCISIVDEVFTIDHETLVSEEEWITTASQMIKEHGSDKFLKLLLENLKGNYVTGEETVEISSAN